MAALRSTIEALMPLSKKNKRDKLKKIRLFCSIATNILSKENRIAAEERWHWKSRTGAGISPTLCNGKQSLRAKFPTLSHTKQV